MYTYRTIDAPQTPEAARARVVELQPMFVFTTYAVAETTSADGVDAVDIIAVTEDDDAEYGTIGAALGAYIEACQARGLKVWNIDEVGRS